jgi:putative transposase
VPRLRRLIRAAGTYSVGSRTWNRRLIFIKEAPARLFIDCLFDYREEGHYQLHEFSVMPDHFHLLITLAPRITLERALQFIKGGSSHRIKKELSYTFPLWQKGFHDHRIRNAADYQQHKAYILLNPVRERLARTPENIPSALRIRNTGIV